MDGAGLRLRLLGPLEADVRAAAADLGGLRRRAVLALLLVARGEVFSVDRDTDMRCGPSGHARECARSACRGLAE